MRCMGMSLVSALSYRVVDVVQSQGYTGEEYM